MICVWPEFSHMTVTNWGWIPVILQQFRPGGSTLMGLQWNEILHFLPLIGWVYLSLASDIWQLFVCRVLHVDISFFWCLDYQLLHGSSPAIASAGYCPLNAMKFCISHSSSNTCNPRGSLSLDDDRFPEVRVPRALLQCDIDPARLI